MIKIRPEAAGIRLWALVLVLAGCLFVFSLSLIWVSPVQAWSSEDLGWTEWEKEHAVARKETWMVIKEPGMDGCYIKQGYADQEMMDLSVDEGGSPCLWGPFSSTPVDVEVRYEIDDLKQGRMTARKVTNGIRLPRDLVQTMRRGFFLRVEMKSLDPDTELGTVSEQEFSLLGFTGATEVLDSDACRE
ncbi:MAG: hypothetical protein ACLFPB_07035 [Desulfovermiculus sp.]